MTRQLLDILVAIVRGPRCPICDERTRNMSFHVRFDHADIEVPVKWFCKSCWPKRRPGAKPCRRCCGFKGGA